MIPHVILAALDRLLMIGTTVLRLSVRARPGSARVSRYTLTHPRNRFNQQPLLLSLYGVRAQKINDHFIQNNGPGIFKNDSARLHTTCK